MKPWWLKLAIGIGTYITIIPISLCLIKLKKLDKTYFGIFFWMISMACIEYYAGYQFRLKINNYPSWHLMIALNVLFAGYYFYRILINRALKLFVLIIGLSLLLFIAFNAFYIVDIYSHPNISLATQCIVLMIWSFLYFHELLQSKHIINLSQSPEFIIVSGILLYYGTTQWLQLFQGITFRNNRELDLIFQFYNILFMIFYYVLIGVGVWKKQ